MEVLAEKVALDYIEDSVNSAKNGTRPKSIAELALARGASKAYAHNGTLTQTDAFLRVVEKFKPRVTKNLIKHVDRSLKSLNEKDLNEVSYRDLIAGIDTGHKIIQLNTGGATENTNVAIVGMQMINDTQHVEQHASEHVNDMPNSASQVASQDSQAQNMAQQGDKKD